ncbi:hypothetical protein ACN081_05465 [Rothia sp. P13129]|uniref:arsenate reductase/protein-tyrosine-phosphatase family protein n=1 Tax=Rothia sp. P13129 TaxID=3402664 RepID=UPI003AC82806
MARFGLGALKNLLGGNKQRKHEVFSPATPKAPNPSTGQAAVVTPPTGKTSIVAKESPVVSITPAAPVSRKIPEGAKKILFVCTGNIARSASAQYLAQSMVPSDSPWIFDSAGTGAVVGSPVASHIDKELERRGVPYLGHQAKQINTRLLAESELVLVMERAHLDWIVQEWPQYRSKVRLLREMSRLREGAGRRSDPISYMKQHDSEPLAKDDIADPYRRGAKAAQKAVKEIEESLNVIIAWLGH